MRRIVVQRRRMPPRGVSAAGSRRDWSLGAERAHTSSQQSHRGHSSRVAKPPGKRGRWGCQRFVSGRPDAGKRSSFRRILVSTSTSRSTLRTDASRKR